MFIWSKGRSIRAYLDTMYLNDHNVIYKEMMIHILEFAIKFEVHLNFLLPIMTKDSFAVDLK